MKINRPLWAVALVLLAGCAGVTTTSPTSSPSVVPTTDPPTVGEADSAALMRKADESVLKFLQDAAPDEVGSVGVFLVADTGAAVQSVKAKHPSVTWLGDRPDTSDAKVADQIEREMTDAKVAVIKAAETAFAARAESLGFSVQSSSSVAPLVFVELPASQFAAIAALNEVVELGMNGSGWHLAHESPR